MPISPFKAVATLLSVGLFTLNASAALYGTIGAGSGISTFVEINPATGALVSTIGSVGYRVNGMTYDQTTGTLYATTSSNDTNCPRGLITINPATGAGTQVGCNAHPSESPALLTSDSAGNLYSWLEPGPDDLIMWNKATGTIGAPIGDAGLGTGGHSLAFDNTDVLYLLQDTSLYTISTTTGASTSMGSVSGPSTVNHHGDFNPADNRLYAIDETGNGNNPRNINVIDVATKSVVTTLPTVDDLHVLAFAGPVVPPVTTGVQAIPTLSQWAMLITALTLGLFGFLSLRRRVE